MGVACRQAQLHGTACREEGAGATRRFVLVAVLVVAEGKDKVNLDGALLGIRGKDPGGTRPMGHGGLDGIYVAVQVLHGL